MVISRQKEARSRDYVLLLSNDIKGFFIVHNTIDNINTPQAFERFGVLYMHKLDDKHSTDRD